jgi:GH24 family phage-related lysozyme (muramidase)
MVARIEQYVEKAMWDPIGECWDYGFGFTQRMDGSGHVRQGDTISLANAKVYMTRLLASYTQTIADAIHAPLTTPLAAALYDFSHEEGSHALGGSLLADALNAGNLALARVHLGGWIIGGGKPELGIARRRVYEGFLGFDFMDEGVAYDRAWTLGITGMNTMYQAALNAAHTMGWPPAPAAVVVAAAAARPAPLRKANPAFSLPASTQDEADALMLQYNPTV